MSATAPRYTYSDKKTSGGFAKKTLIQSTASILLLGGAFFVCKSNTPYSENFKSFIKRTLSVSTDTESIKKTAVYLADKSGLDNLDFFKNTKNELEEKQKNEENEEITNVLAAEEEKTDTSSKEAENTVKAENINLDSLQMPAFRNPTEGKISDTFGMRTHPITGEENNLHTGIDIAGVLNQTVISAAEGIVEKTAEDDLNGKYIIIRHSGGYSTSYAHLNKISVTEGEYVDQNTKIGLMGQSGSATGVHLHFEIKKNGERVNPEEFVLYKHK